MTILKTSLILIAIAFAEAHAEACKMSAIELQAELDRAELSIQSLKKLDSRKLVLEVKWEQQPRCFEDQNLALSLVPRDSSEFEIQNFTTRFPYTEFLISGPQKSVAALYQLYAKSGNLEPLISRRLKLQFGNSMPLSVKGLRLRELMSSAKFCSISIAYKLQCHDFQGTEFLTRMECLDDNELLRQKLSSTIFDSELKDILNLPNIQILGFESDPCTRHESTDLLTALIPYLVSAARQAPNLDASEFPVNIMPAVEINTTVLLGRGF